MDAAVTPVLSGVEGSGTQTAAKPAPKSHRRHTPQAIDPVTRKFVRTEGRPPVEEPDGPPPGAMAPFGLGPAELARIAAYLQQQGLIGPAPVAGPTATPAPRKGSQIRLAARPEDATPATPFRVWTAGPNMPQTKIYMPDFAPGLKPRSDGAYYLTSPEQVAWARDVLRRNRRWWPDTMPDDEPAQKCDHCGWHCRNYEAMNTHLNHAHGRPQAS